MSGGRGMGGRGADLVIMVVSQSFDTMIEMA
jgi:hypothetical protein